MDKTTYTLIEVILLCLYALWRASKAVKRGEDWHWFANYLLSSIIGICIAHILIQKGVF
jgi:uncharacterized membrane protein